MMNLCIGYNSYQIKIIKLHFCHLFSFETLKFNRITYLCIMRERAVVNFLRSIIIYLTLI